ncbi:MAG: hypothetical protein KDJ28_01740 [Candidatus Competibacteraceae bacterium]|nr:hypothetical protein [Candidatus Competibacteraceae bacterium]
MRFKMNKLAAAVAVTMGVSAVGVSTAQADEILFPYVVASDTVTTLISTINIYENSFQGPAADQLHYRYYYKNGVNAENNLASCAEVDDRLPSSPNDIVTFDVAERFGAGNLGILFEDVATSSNVDYGSKTFSLLNITLPVRAFLIVDNNDTLTGAGLVSTANSVAGEAIILEFAAGAAWGYSAYNAAGLYSGTAGGGAVVSNPYDFSDSVETAGEVIANSYVPVALMPFTATGGEFITRFFVTPIATRAMGSGTPQLRSDLNARIRLAVRDPASATQDAIFDRDELPVSGQFPQNVVCVGAVEASEMLTEGALNRVPNGGWSNLVVSSGTVAGATGTVTSGSTDQAIVFKLEYNPSALELDTDSGTDPVAGIVNNAIWLRKGIRESYLAPASATQPRVSVFAADLDLNSPAPIGTSGVQ